MYEESGKLIFNGHGFEGPEAIGKLYENVPKSLTRVLSFDAHEIAGRHFINTYILPLSTSVSNVIVAFLMSLILETYLKGAPAILILVTGRVKYGGGTGESRSFDDSNSDPKKYDFYETFVITAKSGTWKIQSDNFRYD